MHLFFLHAGLALFWVALKGQTWADLGVGLVLGYFTVLVGDNLWYAENGDKAAARIRFYPIYQVMHWDTLREEFSGLLNVFAQLLWYASLILFYLALLLQSTLVVIWHVLRPGQTRPGIVELPLKCTRQFEVVLLNALITMSPGTVGVDVRFYVENGEYKKMLYVHCLHIADKEAVVADLKYLQEVLLLAVRGRQYFQPDAAHQEDVFEYEPEVKEEERERVSDGV